MPSALEKDRQLRTAKQFLDLWVAVNRYTTFADTDIKFQLSRTQTLNVLPFKPGAGPCIAMHVTPTARDFFLANYYPSGPFTCIFSNPLPFFSPVLAMANTGSRFDVILCGNQKESNMTLDFKEDNRENTKDWLQNSSAFVTVLSILPIDVGAFC